MFSPPLYRVSDPVVAWSLIEDVRLGTLVTAGSTPLVGSHIPFMLDRDAGPHGTLIGHLDRGNPQWRALEAGEEAMITFLGPDSYVSASWYGKMPRVPTWYYAAVHAYGRAVMVEDPLVLRRMIVDLSLLMEPPGSVWRPDAVDAYIDRLTAGIVGFWILIERLDTQLRAGQQNRLDDKRRVRAALSAGDHRQARAGEMVERYDPLP